MFKQMTALNLGFIEIAVQVVEQIIIKVFHAAFFKLLVKDPVHILLLWNKEGREFGSELKAFPWMSFYKGLADGGL